MRMSLVATARRVDPARPPGGDRRRWDHHRALHRRVDGVAARGATGTSTRRSRSPMRASRRPSRCSPCSTRTTVPRSATPTTGARRDTRAPATYEWTAAGSGTNLWQVRSVGSSVATLGTLEAEMGPLYLFGLAAFGDCSCSSCAAGTMRTPTPVEGGGTVGSNNQITLRGNATVDWVAATAARRTTAAGSSAQAVGSRRESADCCPISVFRRTPLAVPATRTTRRRARQRHHRWPLQHGETYCVSQARFPAGEHLLARIRRQRRADADLHRAVRQPRAARSGQQPLHGRVLRQLRSERRSPDATALEIYLAGGGGEVLANNHSRIAAGIYAPLSNCSGRTPRATSTARSCVARSTARVAGRSTTTSGSTTSPWSTSPSPASARSLVARRPSRTTEPGHLG
jgi:hypothetical protein